MFPQNEELCYLVARAFVLARKSEPDQGSIIENKKGVAGGFCPIEVKVWPKVEQSLMIHNDVYEVTQIVTAMLHKIA